MEIMLAPEIIALNSRFRFLETIMRRFALIFLVSAVSMLLPRSQAVADVLITVDKSDQQMTVEVDGVPRWTWPVSTGRLGRDTPSGSFGPLWMKAEYFSKEWDNAPMPHAIFFTDNGHAIHGTESIKQLGSAASHGCIRLAPVNAEKLYAVVHEQGLAHTRIVVTEGAQIASAKATGRRSHVVSREATNRQSEAGTARRSASTVKEPGRPSDVALYQSFGDFQPDYAYNRFR
jgi:hypothetical protein